MRRVACKEQDDMKELALGILLISVVFVSACTSSNNINISGDPYVGGINASVTVVEFSDFQCPACRAGEPTVKQLITLYGDKIKFVYKNFPLPMHQYGEIAAEAGECANEQGKFWEYHDKLFDNQAEWAMQGQSKLKDYAKDLGLDTGKFNTCLDTGAMKAKVAEDTAEGERVGMQGTPTFFINGEKFEGTQPLYAFRAAIDKYLTS